MPQFTRFPPLPPGPYKAAVTAFVDVLRAWPAEGEPFRTVRTRLKRAEMWHRDHADDLWHFLRVAPGEHMARSPELAAMAAADDDKALNAIADRLWAVNPVLAHAMLSRITDRVNTANELLKYVESFAYPGVRLTGPQIRRWLAWAQGLELVRPVGVGLGLGERGKRLTERLKLFDVDEFLEEDEPEVPPAAAAMPASDGPAEVAPEVAAEPAADPPLHATPAAPAAPAPAPTRGVAVAPAPVGPPSNQPERGVPVRRLRGGLDAELRADTTAHLRAWWGDLDTAPIDPASWEAVGLDGPAWMEDPHRTLFRLAVAAGLQFEPQRAPAAGRAAFIALDQAGVLDALHEGTAPPRRMAQVEADALLLASLVARRFAEHPTLPEDLERADDAAGAFERLGQALGGLFTVEIFWILRALHRTGVLRLKGAAAFTAVPHRDVRDTLFRLGFLASPYAATLTELAAAAQAARAAVGEADAPEVVLRAFAAGAGCAFGCPHATSCGVACQERAELP
ncbi:MAG: hypothetical protein H6702_13525 [Myxococcales bacterium]|nr:hypothetical protein [Myxococcales bacterium]